MLESESTGKRNVEVLRLLLVVIRPTPRSVIVIAWCDENPVFERRQSLSGEFVLAIPAMIRNVSRNEKVGVFLSCERIPLTDCFKKRLGHPIHIGILSKMEVTYMEYLDHTISFLMYF